MQLPDYLTRYSAPSSSSSSSQSYDYSGFDDHIKRQDAIGALRDNKMAALYGGDVMGSVSSGNKIRDLLKSVRANAPAASERDPVHLVTPLVRVSSSSQSSNSGGADFTGNTRQVGLLPPPGGHAAPPVAQGGPDPASLRRAAREGRRPERQILGTAGNLNAPGSLPEFLDDRDKRRRGPEHYGDTQYV